MTSGLGRSDTGPTPYLQEDHKFLAKQGDKTQSECCLELREVLIPLARNREVPI